MKNKVVRKYNILVDVIYCFVKEAHALDGFMCGSLKGDVVIVLFGFPENVQGLSSKAPSETELSWITTGGVCSSKMQR